MIHYLRGDATNPIETGGPRFILHVCNSVGGWGRGFVLALSKRWPEPEREYRKWYREGRTLLAGEFELGAVQIVPVQGDPPLSVVNMVAQEGYGKGNRGRHQGSEPNTRPPIRYYALEKCLRQIGAMAQGTSLTMHMPRIGCGLAGGTWDEVEPLIETAFPNHKVYVYDL